MFKVNNKEHISGVGGGNFTPVGFQAGWFTAFPLISAEPQISCALS